MKPYKPDLSVKYAPRINRRFAQMVDRISRREQLRKGDVLQYCFEAAVSVWKGRDIAVSTGAYDAMVTVRTSSAVRKQVYKIWLANPDVIEADVLRALLEWILPIAISKRMSYVMRLRERML